MDTVNGVVSRDGIFGDVTARSAPGPLNTNIPVILSNVDTGNTRILPESANSPPQSRSGQSNVFSRLQALFPGSPSINSPSSPSNTQAWSSLSAGQHTGAMTQLGPQALKVRIISWNMYDSLPKGKLEELLGSVPLYTPPLEGERESSVIPELPLDDSHPYHLVVRHSAGQECPTSSGIPMGLGAALNNIIEREKGKDKSPYTIDENVFIGAPTGSRKLFCAEFALLRLVESLQCVRHGLSVKPLKRWFTKRGAEWYEKVSKLQGGKEGYQERSVRIYDFWGKAVGNVQDIGILIADEVRLVGGEVGPTYEVVVSRNVTWLPVKTRIVACGVSLGIRTILENGLVLLRMLYSFAPSARPLDMNIHSQSFTVPHFPSVMLEEVISKDQHQLRFYDQPN